MVRIDPDNNKYDMGELRLDKESIVSEEFSIDLTSNNETKNATNSRDPYRYAGGKNEYSWSASGVAPEHLSLLREYQKSRKSFPTGVYNFDDDGDYEEQFVLKYCRISSVSVSQGDEGLSLDVEGIALGIKD